MAETSGGIPSTWPELLAREEEDLPEQIEDLSFNLELLTTRKPAQAPMALAGADNVLASAAVVEGSAEARAIAVTFLPHVPRAVEGLGAVESRNVVGAITIAGFLHACRTAGVALPPGLAEAERGVVAHLARGLILHEPQQQAAALLALAHGQADRAAEIIGGGPLPASVRPGETFQLSVHGYVRYLAAALKSGASASAVGPALHDLIRAFPHKLGASTMDWVQLLAAAAAYYVHFERRPVGEVADALHALVRAPG